MWDDAAGLQIWQQAQSYDDTPHMEHFMHAWTFLGFRRGMEGGFKLKAEMQPLLHRNLVCLSTREIVEKCH